jgi:hypothetical protein
MSEAALINALINQHNAYMRAYKTKMQAIGAEIKAEIAKSEAHTSRIVSK